jgi:hypothetical protein
MIRLRLRDTGHNNVSVARGFDLEDVPFSANLKKKAGAG